MLLCCTDLAYAGTSDLLQHHEPPDLPISAGPGWDGAVTDALNCGFAGKFQGSWRYCDSDLVGFRESIFFVIRNDT